MNFPMNSFSMDNRFKFVYVTCKSSRFILCSLRNTEGILLTSFELVFISFVSTEYTCMFGPQYIISIFRNVKSSKILNRWQMVNFSEFFPQFFAQFKKILNFFHNILSKNFRQFFSQFFAQFFSNNFPQFYAQFFHNFFKNFCTIFCRFFS